VSPPSLSPMPSEPWEAAPPRTGPQGVPDPAAGRDPGELVDLDRHPLLDLASPSGAQLAARARADLVATGACELPEFLTPAGLAACLADALALEPLAHHSHGTTNAFLAPTDPTRPDDHPRNRRSPFRLGAVAYDRFPPSSPIRALYEWEPLRAFLAAVVGLPEVHRYADPLGALNLAVMGPGDELGWHFDQTDFVVSLAVRSSDGGGELEVVPGLRGPGFDDHTGIGRAHDGSIDPLVVPNVAGTLLVFAGRWSLHRVSRVLGSTSRLMVLFGFDDRPDARSTPELQRSRYGRTAP
jgi:hypothetical protein